MEGSALGPSFFVSSVIYTDTLFVLRLRLLFEDALSSTVACRLDLFQQLEHSRNRLVNGAEAVIKCAEARITTLVVSISVVFVHS